MMEGNTNLKGYKASEETKKRMSIARKGKKTNHGKVWKIKIQKRMAKLNKEKNKFRPQNQKGFIRSDQARINHKKAMENIVWSDERKRETGKRTAERNRKNSIKNNPEYWTPERRAKMIRTKRKKRWK